MDKARIEAGTNRLRGVADTLSLLSDTEDERYSGALYLLACIVREPAQAIEGATRTQSEGH